MKPSILPMTALAACFGLASGVLIAGAAPAPASVPASAIATEPTADDMPMADFLGLLAQIAPAAEAGAKTYLRAIQQRCGRSLQTAELRRAMSEGDGDPVLMAMIRANHLRDAAALTQLGQRIHCEPRGAR